jgi:hypothetical protein
MLDAWKHDQLTSRLGARRVRLCCEMVNDPPVEKSSGSELPLNVVDEQDHVIWAHSMVIRHVQAQLKKT